MSPTDPERPDQRADRAEQARRMADLRAGAQRRESQAAQELIDAFVAEATRQRLRPVPLRAVLMSGPTVRTDRTGWYLRRNRSLAIGVDGGYYVLTIPGGLAERLRGARLTPSPPPIYVGAGGRDGETGELAWFLERVLAGDTGHVHDPAPERPEG